MKRLVLLLVGAVIIGKLFVGIVVRLSKATPTQGPHLVLSTALDDHLRLGPMADATAGGATMAPTTHRTFLANAPALAKINPKAKVDLKIAAADKEKKAKEEADRRKKRRKKLEEETAKTDQTQPQPSGIKATAAQVQFQPGTPPSYSGGAYQPPTTTNADGSPNTSTPAKVVPFSGGQGAPAMNITSWTNLLVHTPTASLMKSFVGLFNGKQISAAQFYSVLNAMEKSTVVLSRQYAVQAAGLYVNLESFQVLADESVSETDPGVKATANQDVVTYENVNELSILSQALTSGDVNEKYVATSFIKTVVSSLNSKQIPQNVAQTLSSLIPILTQLASQPSTLSEVQTGAEAALQAINTALGTSTTQPV